MRRLTKLVDGGRAGLVEGVRQMRHMLRWIVSLALLGLILAVVGSTMLVTCMPGHSFREPLPPLKPYETDVVAELRRHIRKLGGEIGERNVYRPGAYASAAEYIASEFAGMGYTVERQSFKVLQSECQNLVVETKPTRPGGGVLVVGAHYDSEAGCPAANDNASGVAAVLVLARQVSGRALERTVRFVAFANEEAPFFGTEEMGSLRYARACEQRGDNIVGMLSLETIGCYSDEPGSQQYPQPFSLLYPSTGNFVGFVGNLQSRSFVRDVIGTFRLNARFPSEGAAMPGLIPQAGWSDHWAFWQCGYPAIMVTDTAPFRYPQYHTPQDLPDRLDYERMARVVVGLERTLIDLAGGAP